jgi:hypothetical protein
MSAPQTALVSMFVSALMVGPLAISATADPIVVIPGALGYVDTTVTDAGERGDVKRGSTEKGSAAAAAVSAGVRCTYTPVGLAGLGSDLTASLAALVGGLNSLRMGVYAKSCSDGSLDMVWRDPFSLGGPGGEVTVTPGQLAQVAYSRLRLPTLRARFNPARHTSAGLATTVHLPTWWWVEDWTDRVQRTSAGAVWAEVTARPVRTEWRPGDGGRAVTCAGPGRRWRPGLSESASSCRYAYGRSSAGEPDLNFDASVTVTWEVSWVGAGGANSTLPPMSTTTTFPVAVTERQSVVTDSGGGRGDQA